MPTPIQKLIEAIDQFDIWLQENPNSSIPKEEKDRMKAISDKIIDSPELGEAQWNILKPILRKTKTQHKPGARREFVKCELCRGKVLAKNLNKHKIKCQTRWKIRSGKSRGSSHQREIPRDIDTKGLSSNDFQENRRLDGSKDYWQFRENGKYGSHSSYDEMGDESFS